MTGAEEVLVETLAPGGWVSIGTVSEVEPPGSMSSFDDEGRRVLVFGWWDGKPGVYQSRAGFDIETEAFRQIETLGLDLLSDLTEPYEFDVARPGNTIRVRCTLRATHD